MFSTRRTDIFVLISLSLFAFLSVIWVREVDLNEAKIFISAREMLKYSHWWTPTLNGKLHFENLPLPMWLAAITMWISRSQSEVILRVPSILVGIFTVLFLYKSIIKIKKDRMLAFLCAFSLLSTFMFIKLGAENTWDIYSYSFAFCASLALYNYFLYEEFKDLKRMGIFLILSFLSKGPIAIYSVFLPFLISYFITFPQEFWKKKMAFTLIIFIIAIAIASTWSISMYLDYGDKFLDVAKTEVRHWSTRHRRSFIFYTDYFVYMGSWAFFAFFTLIKKPERKDDKVFYLWTIISLILVSVINMKKKRYGFPIYLTSSINIGLLCVYFFRTPYENLKKREKLLLFIQKNFLLFVVLTSLCFLTYFGYMKEELSFGLFFLYLVLHILFFYLFAVGYTEISYAKRIVIFTGLTMLLVNFSSSWILESKFMQSNLLRFEIPVDKEIKNNNIAIYSNNFSMEDVWKIGREIQEIDNIPLNTEIFFLGENLPEKITKYYDLIKTYDYQTVDHEMKKIFYLKKKELL